MEEKVQYVSAENIKIREDLPRIRTDMGKIQEVADSIKKFGQLQPVVINRNYELIAGGRRLEACKTAGVPVMVIFSDTVDPLTMREMELEENIQRKQLTPAEEVLAVAELHKLKTTKYGETTLGPMATGWSLEDTGDILGKTKQAISMDLMLAKAISQFPELAGCKTKAEIKKVVESLTRAASRMEALEEYEDTAKEIDKIRIYQADAIELMGDIEDASIDVLLTDPPYGIDIDSVQISTGGRTGGVHNPAGFKFEDDAEKALGLYAALAGESYRFVKDSGFAFVFVAPSHFPKIKLLFNAAGWNVAERPIIWIKRSSGQNNWPDRWFSSAYEMIMFARRENSSILLQGKADWIQCDPVGQDKLHVAEKPVALLKELLARVAYPNSSVFDPFMGSGSTLVAALELKMRAIGCDVLPEAYASACQRLAEWKQRKEEGL